MKNTVLMIVAVTVMIIEVINDSFEGVYLDDLIAIVQ